MSGDYLPRKFRLAPVAPGAAQVTTTGVSGMVPASGAGLTGTSYTFSFSDTQGRSDLGVMNILVNTALDGRQACYLAYSRADNNLYLMDDAGDALLPGRYAGGPDGFNNSQCAVSWTASSVPPGSNGLTLTLNIRFSGGFGPHVIFYLAARDRNEGNNTGWQSMGTWSVQ